MEKINVQLLEGREGNQRVDRIRAHVNDMVDENTVFED